MEIYLIDRETNEVKSTYINVVRWGADFVEQTNNGLRSKVYCDIETEYFGDKNTTNINKLNEDLQREREDTDIQE